MDGLWFGTQIVLDANNTAPMAAEDADGSEPSGYVWYVPDNFYQKAKFWFVAMFDSPAVAGMTCKIHYHKLIQNPGQVNRQTDMTKSLGYTTMLGNEIRFPHGGYLRSSTDFLDVLDFPEWRSCFVIEFLSPDGVSCDPGEWKLYLVFELEPIAE